MTLKIRELLWNASEGWNYPFTGIDPALLDRADELLKEHIDAIKANYTAQLEQQAEYVIPITIK